MSLTKTQVSDLGDAIKAYKFPVVYFDFKTGKQVVATSMSKCEKVIKKQLLSTNLLDVKDGLSNIIYWGNATAGYRGFRVDQFRGMVSTAQLQSFQELVKGGSVPSLKKIKDLKMSGYSGISFISKILMFLNPTTHCVLDLQLTSLGSTSGSKAIDNIKFNTQIPITKNNMNEYDNWRNECFEISKLYFGSVYRAVDIERGFFSLIQASKKKLAQDIYRDA